MSQIKNYIREHEARFLEDLFELIRIPSVSAKSEHKPDMQRCAEYWRDHLKKLGVQTVEIYQTAGNPIVFGHYEKDPSKPTILVYGHYDVMPPEPLELWKSEPFEPEVRDGHIWARGADDDKGQSMIQVKGFETALALGLVECNVKFLLEGEEEIGSTHLEQFCREHLEMLRAENIIVSDTSMVSAETPSLTTGLRGLAYWQIEVTGANHDLHSGHFGGAVANPINELCKLIAQVQDKDGRITIPHFYDDVVPLSDEERAMIAKIPFSEEEYKKFLDLADLFGAAGYHTHTLLAGMEDVPDLVSALSYYNAEHGVPDIRLILNATGVETDELISAIKALRPLTEGERAIKGLQLVGISVAPTEAPAAAQVAEDAALLLSIDASTGFTTAADAALAARENRPWVAIRLDDNISLLQTSLFCRASARDIGDPHTIREEPRFSLVGLPGGAFNIRA